MNRWKTQYISLTQEAKTLASLIGSRPDWAWAAANKTDIESLEIDMRKIAEAPFVVELLAFDIAHIKRKFSEDRIFAETDPSLVIMCFKIMNRFVSLLGLCLWWWWWW